MKLRVKRASTSQAYRPATRSRSSPAAGGIVLAAAVSARSVLFAVTSPARSAGSADPRRCLLCPAMAKTGAKGRAMPTIRVVTRPRLIACCARPPEHRPPSGPEDNAVTAAAASQHSPQARLVAGARRRQARCGARPPRDSRHQSVSPGGRRAGDPGQDHPTVHQAPQPRQTSQPGAPWRLRRRIRAIGSRPSEQPVAAPSGPALSRSKFASRPSRSPARTASGRLRKPGGRAACEPEPQGARSERRAEGASEESHAGHEEAAEALEPDPAWMRFGTRLPQLGVAAAK